MPGRAANRTAGRNAFFTGMNRYLASAQFSTISFLSGPQPDRRWNWGNRCYYGVFGGVQVLPGGGTGWCSRPDPFHPLGHRLTPTNTTISVMFGQAPPIATKECAERSLPTCRYTSPRNTCCISISKTPRRSASKSHRPSSPAREFITLLGATRRGRST